MTRDPAAIGAGLAPPRPARPIWLGERIHIVGIAGAGASAAALLAHRAGADVSGCDAGGPSPYTAALEAAGIALTWSHDPGHVGDGSTAPPDRLGVTKALTAVQPDHPELAAARARGIAVEAWQQIIADAATDRQLVAIAGTHGKSTTAGWLVHVLVTAGWDPSAFVGALLPAAIVDGVPATARWGRGPAFIVEADEYAGNFDAYRPSIAVVTSIEWDHPDVFADRADVVRAFEGWLESAATRSSGSGDSGRLPVLVANVVDAGVGDLLERLADWPGRIVRVGLAGADGVPPADAAVGGSVVQSDPSGTVLAIKGLAGNAEPAIVRLPTAGRHNAANALAVAAVADLLGADRQAIERGLATFEGVGRRLERKGEAGGVVVYDDYGHHPTAIQVTLDALRQREPGRRIWAVYEPLTYHRTAALLDDFATVLATADGVAIADIWAGRDPDTTVASANDLATAIARRRPGIVVAAPGSVEQTADWLAAEVTSGDAILVMGGGRSYRIGELILQHLDGR